MRIQLRDRVDIGRTDNDTYFNPKNLSFREQLETGIRMALRNTKGAKRKREMLESKKYQEQTERIENLKTMMLQQIYRSMSPTENPRLRKTNRKAVGVVIAVSRRFEDIIDDIITHQEFEGYTITRYSENEDVLIACPNLPILIRFVKKVIDEDIK